MSRSRSLPASASPRATEPKAITFRARRTWGATRRRSSPRSHSTGGSMAPRV
jgi:hypothetical protein